MIAGLRKSLRSWATLLLLFIALAAIVVTGFGTGGVGGIGSMTGAGSPSETLATVEGKAIPASDITDLVTRQFAAARARQPDLSMEAFLAQGIFEQTLSQSIASEAVQHFARERGFVVSDRMIDRLIVNIPEFRNFTGQFDQGTYLQVLQQQNLTEARFRADLTRQLNQRQLLAPIALGARVPQNVARQYANLMLERRRGTIALITADAVAAGINPSDAEIADFYRRNARAFTVPERRVIKYALLGFEQVGQAATATDAEIRQVYQANSGRFGARETRSLQHVVLQSEADARSFVQRVRGGTSFADAAAQAGFAPRDISFADQSREQFGETTTAEVAAAAFAAAQGAVAGPVRSELGFHVVRVERITGTPARSLEAARPEIVAFIERRKRVEALGDLITRIEDRLAEDESFDQIVRAERLTVVTTPAIAANGRPVGGGAFQPAAELQPMLEVAFGIDPEELVPIVEQIEPNSRFALLHVQSVEPAAPLPLAQVRDRVRAAVARRQALQRARTIAEGIARQINGGTAPAAAFAAAQPRPQAQEINVRRLEIEPGNGQPPPQPLLVLFSLQQNRARAVEAPDRSGWLIVHHAERTPGDAHSDPRALPAMTQRLAATVSEEIAQQFARSAELRAEISRDEDAIRRVRRTVGGALE